MAAMSASNWNPALKVFHDRLKIAANCRRCLDRLQIVKYG
jgi:hypothetical protein